ncbi:hypothetical protein HDU91_006693 [Kappamyces sp. JEL0680]|nr:hypothetical protein HDU91_006693 [Kappamyces sp. JEL0680]
MQEYLALIARKSLKYAEASQRSVVCLLDLQLCGVTLPGLERYLQALQTNLAELEDLMQGNHQPVPAANDDQALDDWDEDVKMEAKPDASAKEEPSQAADENGDIHMAGSGDDTNADPDSKVALGLESNGNGAVHEDIPAVPVSSVPAEKPLATDPNLPRSFPPLPVERDYKFLEEKLQLENANQQVPSWEQVEEGDDQDLYYHTQSLDDYSDFIGLEPPPPSLFPQPPQDVDMHGGSDPLPSQTNGAVARQPAPLHKRTPPKMDDLVVNAMRAHTLNQQNTKHYPLMSHSELLTLLTFRSHFGVGVPDGNGSGSAGYESKSVLGDLLLLRMPAMHKLFSGERDLEPGGKLASELYQMPRTRKKEKARDTGQGKAPVKTLEQKLARKEKMEEAAQRKKVMLAEAAVRREVKKLAKLKKAQEKGVKMDQTTLQLMYELQQRVGGIILPKRETKRGKAKKEAEEAAKKAAESQPTAASSQMSAFSPASAATPARDDDEFSESDASEADDVASALSVVSAATPKLSSKPPSQPVKSVDKPLPAHNLPKPSSSQPSPKKLTLSLKVGKKPEAAPQPVSTTLSARSVEDVINCICPNPGADFGQFMVACEECDVWYHGSCVGMIETSQTEFICRRCK